MDNQKFDNEVLDKIIMARRTERRFTEEIPPKALVEQVIEAGRLAPFAGLPNAGTSDFRRFFVFSRDSAEIPKLQEMILETAKANLAKYEPENNPRMQAMIKALRMTVQNGSYLGSSPWFMIVADRRGYPAREEQAIAHCMQNMWLKATALGLGFQMVSAISDLGDSQALSELLGLTPGEFCCDGCMIGYPATPGRSGPREVPHLLVKWFE